jgi:thermitase
VGVERRPEIDIVAPGVHIYTTDIMGGAGYAGGNYVTNFNGTSSATRTSPEPPP